MPHADHPPPSPPPAQDFASFQNKILSEGAVKMLLDMTSPSNDPYLIKETLACLGRITQGNAGIQKELRKVNAIKTYSQLLFAQTLHDSAITELAALALVNLCSEVQSPAFSSFLSPSPAFSDTPPLLLPRCPPPSPASSSTLASARSASRCWRA